MNNISYKLVALDKDKQIAEYKIPYIYAVRIILAQLEPYVKGNLSAERRLEVLIRDHYTCCICGVSDDNIPLNVHHILPEHNGGSSEMNNLVTLCWKCHRNEHNNKDGNIEFSDVIDEVEEPIHRKV